MASLRAFVEIEVFPSVEKAESLGFVVNRVGVNDVHHNGNTLCVRGIDQRLEFFRCAETRTERKKVGDLVAEGAVVWMLLKGHYLECVIAEVGDFRKNIFPELGEGRNFLLFPAHSYMALIYKGVRTFARTAVTPSVGLFRFPDFGAESLCFRVLNSAGDIGRKSFRSASRPLDEEFVEGAVAEEDVVKDNFPIPAPERFESIGIAALPVVELPYQIDSRGIRSPFAEHPFALRRAVESVIEVVVDAFCKRAVHRKAFFGRRNAGVAGVNSLFIRPQPLVRFVYFLDFPHNLRFYGISSVPCPSPRGARPCSPPRVRWRDGHICRYRQSACPDSRVSTQFFRVPRLPHHNRIFLYFPYIPIYNILSFKPL